LDRYESDLTSQNYVLGCKKIWLKEQTKPCGIIKHHDHIKLYTEE
jgi:hypothetical protein